MRSHSFVQIIGADCPARYAPDNRKWQGIATVECTGRRVWAAWMAGGVKEPDPDNHIVLALSDDGGETWLDPFLVIDDPDPGSRGRDPVLWRDTSEQLALFYGFTGDDFTSVLKIPDPTAPVADLTVEEPYAAFPRGMLLNKPVVTKSGECVCMFDPFDAQRGYDCNDCYASCDGGRHWERVGRMYSRSRFKLFQEGTLVERADGALWALLRIEGGCLGGLEQCFSYDGGRTWTEAQNGLGYPLCGPGSRCCLKRLSSGKLLLVNNDSTTALRQNMTAYLSEDEGKSWRALLLDAREGCAYPDAAEDEAGTIYAIFDCGRSERNEIRLCRFTQADAEAGAFVSPRSAQMLTAAKNKAYRDVVRAELGDNEARLYDASGGEHTVKGNWQGRTIGRTPYCRFACDDALRQLRLTDPKGLLLKKAAEISKTEKKR